MNQDELEDYLQSLNFREAPVRVTAALPGPIAARQHALAIATESMARATGKGFPVIFDQGYGVTVKDPDGNVFIDLSSGIGVNSVGRCHPRVVEAIAAQARHLMNATDGTHTRRTELSAKISAIMPEGLRGNCRTYYAQSGSGAMETAIKFAKRITGRQQIIAFHGAYHGMYHASNALTTGPHYRQGFGPFMAGVIHAPYPYAYRFPFDTTNRSAEAIAGEYVDHLLNTPYTGADDVAAVVVEPVQGEGGYIPPGPEFLQRVREACDKSGALLIVDEIQSGVGRTGKMWAVEHSGVAPDMLVFGKGMGGDLPMAGVSLRADLSEQVPEHCQPNTFAANALAAGVALANLEILQDPALDLIGRAARLGERVQQQILGWDHPRIGEVRGRGLMIGIELVEDRQTRKPLAAQQVWDVMFRCIDQGVIVAPCGRWGNVLRIMPSLTIPESLMQKGLAVFREELEALRQPGRAAQ